MPTPIPDADDYGFAYNQTSDKTPKNNPATETAGSSAGDGKKKEKERRRTRGTIGPDEIKQFVKQSAEAATDASKGQDFAGKMALYKFNLDEYDKGRKIISTAMALLITWIHASLRGQLEAFDDPKKAYDYLVGQYDITDAQARELAENQFSAIYATRYPNAQDYINAIKNS
jgi:hypothetical protein